MGERNRFYRSLLKERYSFRVVFSETDVYCLSDKDVEKEVSSLIIKERIRVNEYVLRNPEFLNSLKPVPVDPSAPPIIKNMLWSSLLAGVGPMASVAGALVEEVGVRFFRKVGTLILENGGDIFFYRKKGGIVAIYAGDSPFSGRVGIRIPEGDRFWGISTSSARIGHSLSFGSAHAVTVVSRSPALSDAHATGICNSIKRKGDVERVLRLAQNGLFGEIEGLVVIFGDILGAWGVELVKVSPSMVLKN